MSRRIISVVVVEYNLINFYDGVIADVETLSAIVAYLSWVEIAHVAFAAFNALSVIQNTFFAALIHRIPPSLFII